MARLTRTLIPLACAALLAASGALAQEDAGLYEPAPDPNASYLRVVKGDGTIDAYQLAEGGKATVDLDGAARTLELEPGTFTTVALTADGAQMVADDLLGFSPTKADIAFYNLSDRDDVDLFVPRAKANAVDGVAAGDHRVQALKAPLTLDFEMRASGETLAGVEAVDLRRGEGVSIVLLGRDGSYTAHAAANTYKLN